MAGITEDTLISEFVAESRDHLDSLEPDLLIMEQEGDSVSSEVVNRAFRAIHSIKGSSSVLGFDALMKLSHVMENLLMQIRNKKMTPDANNIDALLQSADKVSFMLDDVHASNQVDCSNEIQRLNDILNDDSQPESQKVTPSAQSDSSQPDSSQPDSSQTDSSHSPETLTVSQTQENKQSKEKSSKKSREMTDVEPEILPETHELETSLEAPDLTEEITGDLISVASDRTDPSETRESTHHATEEITLLDDTHIQVNIHGPDLFNCNILGEKFVNAYNEKKRFYAIWIYGATDLVDKDRTPDEFLNDMISFGTYVYSDFATEKQNLPAIFHMLIFTIFEKELLMNAINIPQNQIYMFEPDLIEKLVSKIQPAKSTSDTVEETADSVITTIDEMSQDQKTIDTQPQVPQEQKSDTNDLPIVATQTKKDEKSGTTHVSPLKTGTGIKLEASGLDHAIFEIDNNKIQSMIEKKKKLFVIWVHQQKDLKDKSCEINELLNDIKSLGECITHDFDRIITDPASQCYHMLVSSIMEQELLSNGLDFPMDQIVQFSSQNLLNAINSQGDASPGKETRPEEIIPSNMISDTRTMKTDITTKSDKSPSPVVKASKPKRPAQGHITENLRVPVDLIDRLMNLAGELVLGRNQLRQEIEEKVVDNPRLINVMQNVNLVTSEIQENIMRMRMQPLSSIFNKFPRVVRDIARQLYKKADIVIEGDEVELDKSILENLSDPLTHIIRNSLDHGIEPPEVRVKKDKPETGSIHLSASHEGSQVIITISDNGRGIDADALAEKAVSTNLVTQEQVARMSTKQKTNLIFYPGFSTAKTVSDISGRGVGMDVVKTNIEKLGGHVDLDTTVGKGTTVIIRLPLTLSIIPSLIVGSCNYTFAIPQINVQELVSIKESEISQRMEKVGDATVLRLRERLLPMVWLNEVLGLKPDKSLVDNNKQPAMTTTVDPNTPENGNRFLEVTQLNSLEKNINIVVLRVGTNSFGLAVNQLFDNEEIVVKPLSRHIKDCKCFSGSTIMGDGRVAMILDTAGIADFAFLRFAEISAEERRRREQEERDKKAASRRKPVLLFNNAFDEYFGLPLSNISRLELIARENIHLVGQREYINYNGKGLPLIRLEHFLAVNPLPEMDELYLIIPKTNGPVAGIMVSRIINILDIQEDIARDAYTPKGFLGSGFIEGYLTFFLDPNAILQFLEEEGV